MWWRNLGAYSKGIVAAAAAVITSLAPFYGGRPWFVGLGAGIGAAAVVLVPNAASIPPAPESGKPANPQ